jgi:hypothetical protein
LLLFDTAKRFQTTTSLISVARDSAGGFFDYSVIVSPGHPTPEARYASVAASKPTGCLIFGEWVVELPLNRAYGCHFVNKMNELTSGVYK